MSTKDQDTIQRCPHDQKNPYVMVSTALIRDATISPECRWLLIYLLSNADGWKIKVKQIANHVKDHMGRDRVRELFNEACEAGYMRKEHVFGAYNYFISETPKFKKFLQSPENQGTDNQGTENQAPLSNIKSSSTLVEEEKKKHLKEKPPNPLPGEEPGGSCVREKLAFGKFVSLEKQDYYLLCSRSGKDVVDGIIEEINDFLSSTGRKPYKDYAATIRNWLRRKQERAPKPKSPPPQIKEASDLNDIQKQNWKLNHDLVNELKIEFPDKCGGFNFYYKHHVLKDKNNPNFDISALIEHRSFCQYLDKHYKLNTEEVIFHGKV